MKIVGITGGMGSGKTTVCKIFEMLGAPVFYADDEAKKLLAQKKINKKVIRVFGKKIVGNDNIIDKKKLAKVVFNDEASLQKLNAIIHPVVKKKFISWLKQKRGSAYVIKEAAILIESGASKQVNFIISVIAHKNLRINRITKRDNLTKEALLSRIKNQISDTERLKYSDYVIFNNETHSLIEQTLNIHYKLSGK